MSGGECVFLFVFSFTFHPVFLLGLVNTGVGCYLYFSAISRLPVQTVAVCGYLEPLAAVVLSAILLGEGMGLIQILGTVLILGGA
ncbi:MAG: DMT family transporter, partial [Anaerotignum sp.]|nr:DMT family transporter [Anaerotignum sp.]